MAKPANAQTATLAADEPLENACGRDCEDRSPSLQQRPPGGAEDDHSEALRTRVLTSMVAYCVLGEGIGLDTCCENSPCVMNNCDSVGEAAATSLLLCPCCLRKLQLNGCLTDVPACLDALREVLSGDALRSVSQRDLDTLREWGH